MVSLGGKLLKGHTKGRGLLLNDLNRILAEGMPGDQISKAGQSLQADLL